MAMDLSQLLVENDAEEADLEAASVFACRGDILGILSTSQENVELLDLLGVEKRAY